MSEDTTGLSAEDFAARMLARRGGAPRVAAPLPPPEPPSAKTQHTVLMTYFMAQVADAKDDDDDVIAAIAHYIGTRTATRYGLAASLAVHRKSPRPEFDMMSSFDALAPPLRENLAAALGLRQDYSQPRTAIARKFVQIQKTARMPAVLDENSRLEVLISGDSQRGERDYVMIEAATGARLEAAGRVMGVADLTPKSAPEALRQRIRERYDALRSPSSNGQPTAAQVAAEVAKEQEPGGVVTLRVRTPNGMIDVDKAAGANLESGGAVVGIYRRSFEADSALRTRIYEKCALSRGYSYER